MQLQAVLDEPTFLDPSSRAFAPAMEQDCACLRYKISRQIGAAVALGSVSRVQHG